MAWTAQDVINAQKGNKVSVSTSQNSNAWTADDVIKLQKEATSKKVASPIPKPPVPSKPKITQKQLDSIASFDFSPRNMNNMLKMTPELQKKLKEPDDNPVQGEDLFLTNTFPIHKKDNVALKVLKGIGNFGTSVIAAPGELIRKTAIQGGSIVSGHGIQKNLPKNTTFVNDILPKGASDAVNNFEKNHPVVGGLAKMGIETLADPTTFIGVGGAKAIQNTTKGLESVGSANKTMLSKLNKGKAVAKEATTTIQDTLKPESNIIPNPEVPKAQTGNKYAAEMFNDSSKATVTPKVEKIGNDPVKTQKYDANGNPISQFRTNTIERSTQITDTARDMFPEEDFAHTKESVKDWASQAETNIQVNKQAVEDAITNAPHSLSKVQQHEAAILANDYRTEAEVTGDYSKYKKFMQTVTKGNTEAGRNLKAIDSAWDKKTVDGAVMDAQRIVDAVETELKKTNPKLIDKINKETKQEIKSLTDLGQNVNPDEIRDFVKKKYNVPVLENADIQAITENMNKAKEFPEGSYENNMYITKAQQIIANKVPATGYEKFRGLQRISLILNPKSLIARNPLGNTILGVGETIKDVPGALIDHIASLFTGERTTALNPINKLKGQAEGFVQGVKEFGKDVKNGVDTSPTRGQLELPSKRVFDNNTLNAIDQFERKALQLGDRPFYQAAYNGRLAELKGLGRTIDESAQAEAKLYALDRVFQGNSVLAKKAGELKRVLGPIGDMVMPFTQTPANVMDKLLDYTPGGFIKSMTQLGDIGKGTFNQKVFVDRLGRTLTGAGISLLGYVMAKNGMIVGQRNADKDVAAYEQGLGKNPYAVKIGDHYYTFDWAQPISGLIAAGADFYQAGKDKKDLISQLGAGGTAAANTLIKQSFLQGVVTLMSGYSPVAGLTKAAMDSTTQAAPTFGSNIAKMIDPNVRETYDPNPIRQMGNKFIAKVPFASELLSPKIDQSGNEILQQQGTDAATKAFNLFINPSNSTTFNPNETQKEILRLYNEGGFKTQVPTLAPKTFDWKGTKFILTGKEYSDFQKTLGQETMKSFESFMKTPEYQALSDEDKSKKLAALIGDAKKVAEFNLIKSKGLSNSPQIMSVPESFTQNKVTKKMTFEQQNELADDINKYEKEYKLRKWLTDEKVKQLAKDKAYKEMKRELFKKQDSPSTITKITPTVSVTPKPKTIEKLNIPSPAPTATVKSKPNYGKGNIDLNDRPVIHNPDGSISTVFSMTFWPDETGEKKYILVPGVRKGLDRQMTPQEALAWYKKTGEYLGKFDSNAEAEKYANSLHEDQAKQYTK